MTFEQSIRAKFGKTPPNVPLDGRARWIKPDIWMLRFADCGVFWGEGSGEVFAWSGGELRQVTSAKNAKERYDLKFERIVVSCGMGLIDRGEHLSDADLIRLGEAMRRVHEGR